MKNKIFDFEDMAKSGLKTAKAIAKVFEKNGAPLAGDPVIDAKTRRTSGINYREVHLLFKDSQKITLRVKQTGDIYQVLLNGRDFPIKEQDDQTAAIKQMAAGLNARRAAFQKRLTQVRTPIKGRGLAVTKKVLVQRLEARSANLAEMIEDAKIELQAVLTGKEPGASSGVPGMISEGGNYKFFDANGALLAADWTGVALASDGSGYWFTTPEPTGRAFRKLNAATYEAALKEAEPIAAAYAERDQKAAADAEPPPSAPSPEPENPEMTWLNGVASGAVDISADLKAASARIRAAQAQPELKTAADAAAKVLADAAIAKARSIVAKAGGSLDTAAPAASEDAAAITITMPWQSPFDGQSPPAEQAALDCLSAEDPDYVSEVTLDGAAPRLEQLNFGAQVEQNSKAKNGTGKAKIDAGTHAWAARKLGSGNGVTITELATAVSKQQIQIHKPKGAMGVWTITVTPFGDYLRVHKTDGLTSTNAFYLV